MAYRAQLPVQFFWASQQAIEKYLKCMLFIRRIPAKRLHHDLGAALELVEASGIPLYEGPNRFSQWNPQETRPLRPAVRSELLAARRMLRPSVIATSIMPCGTLSDFPAVLFTKACQDSRPPRM